MQKNLGKTKRRKFMGRPVKRFLLGYLAVCAAWTMITFLVSTALSHLIFPFSGNVIAIISIAVPIVAYIVCFIVEFFASFSDKVPPIPPLIYMIFGSSEHYISETSFERLKKIRERAKDKDKKEKLDFELYLADKAQKNIQLKSKYLYFALIPVAIVSIVFVVLAIVRFNGLSNKVAECLAAGTGKNFDRNLYDKLSRQIENLVCMAVTSVIYLLIGAYQITRKTCFKCGSYMSYINVETLDFNSSGYDENKTSKTYGESNVYINNERYTIQQEGWQQRTRYVSKATALYLCKCHHCGNEKKVKERYTFKSDWK